MSARYEPQSEFLKAVIAEEAPLAGGMAGERNLRLLMEMTHDEDLSNRDWATLLLAQQDIDTPEVRGALLGAATDRNETVRAEAILGLATRDKQLALPLLRQELAGAIACVSLFEAAEICADPALIEDLRAWAEPSGHPYLDEQAAKALAACEQTAKAEL